MLSDSVPPYYTDGPIGKKSRRNEDCLPADAYLNSTRHLRGQDYLPHPKLIAVWSIQVYAIVLEYRLIVLIGTQSAVLGILKETE
jgi:hypothetical protein